MVSGPDTLKKGDSGLFLFAIYVTEPTGPFEFGVFQPLGYNVSWEPSIRFGTKTLNYIKFWLLNRTCSTSAHCAAPWAPHSPAATKPIGKRISIILQPDCPSTMPLCSTLSSSIEKPCGMSTMTLTVSLSKFLFMY